MVVKMIRDLRKRMEPKFEKMPEMFTKDLETKKTNKQANMNNTLEGINRTMEAEEQISDLEDRMVKIIATEQYIEKRMKRNEDSLRHVWENIKCTNIPIIAVPDGEDRERKNLRKCLQK